MCCENLFSVLLHFRVPGVFIIMINIDKIDLIRAPGNCLLSIFSVRFFSLTKFLLIHPILIWSMARSLDIIWTKKLNNILSNEWELKVV